jgi:hypothetical protein
MTPLPHPREVWKTFWKSDLAEFWAECKVQTLLKYGIVAAFLAPPWSVFMLCIYWYFFDVAPPAIHTYVATLAVDGVPVQRVRRGEKIIVARDSCVTDEGRAFYTRMLVSKPPLRLVYFLPSGEVRLLKDGCARRFNDVTIPPYVTPWTYDYKVTVNFENNPLVETRMTLPIVSFEILP